MPLAQVVLGVVKNLAGLATVSVWVALIARDNGGIVQELEQTSAVARQDDLLFCPLDGGEELGII